MKYRSEVLFGEGYRDAAKVMAHETFILGNTDICDTLSETILKNEKIAEDLSVLSKLIGNGSCDHPKAIYLNEIWESQDSCEGAVFFQKVLDEIENKTGKKIKYCLWLVDDPKDLENYCISETLELEDIDCYQETDIVLSDIGSEGKLYGYKNFPEESFLGNLESM